MKKTLFIFALAALFVSCAKEVEQTPVIFGNVITVAPTEFSATLETPESDTKTTLGGTNGKTVLWEEGDSISVWDGVSAQAKYTLSSGAGTNSATFTSDQTVTGSSLPSNFALYPYDTDMELGLNEQGTGLRINNVKYPTVQNYRENSWDKGAMPMFGNSMDTEDNSLSFHNLAGVLRLTLTGTATIDSIRVFALGENEYAGGVFDFNFDTTAFTSGEKTVTLKCGESGVTLSKTDSTVFNIVIPPITGGFKVVICDRAHGVMILQSNSEIKRNTILNMPAVSYKPSPSLWSAVGNLAGRIQSLVYVPASTDGVATFGSYRILGTGNPVSLTKGTDSKATMTFRVSPASLAEALVAGYEAGTVKMSLLPEKLTRADEIKFEVEGVALGKDGKIDVLARTNYTYPTVDETFAVALQVIDSKKSGEDEIETGIEFTSAYVNTTGSGAVNVYDNIVLVDANLKEVVPTTISDSIAYNNTTASHKFLDGYKYGYKVSATQIITLAEAAAKYNWDVTPSDAVVIARTDFLDHATLGSGFADVDLDPARPMANADAKAKFVTVGLKQAKAENIGKVITDKGNLGIKVGNATIYGSKTYEAKLHITREKLAAITLDTVDFTWKYDTYVGGGLYEKQIQIASGLLTYKQFNQLDFSTATWTCTGAIKTANASASVAAQLASNPSANSDVQLLGLAVSGYNKGTGKLNYKVNVPISDVAEVELNGVINFKGLPEVTFPIKVSDGQYTVDAAAHRLVVPIAENFSDSLYKVNEAALKEFFPTHGKTDFIAFMNGTGLTNNFADKVEKRKLTPTAAAAVTYAGLDLTAAGALNAYFVSDFIDFNDSETYKFSVLDGTKIELAPAGFMVNFIKGQEVTIEGEYHLLRGVDLFLNTEVPYIIAPGVRGVNTYTVSNVYLANAYQASSVVTGAAVTYTLDPVPQGYDAIGTYPEITGATLDWNGCSLDKVTVTATMTVNGLVTDIKTFDVVRKDILAGHKPVQDAAILEVNTSGRDTTVSLLKGVTLKDFADSLVIDPAGILNVNSQAAYDTETEFGAPRYRIKAAGASSFTKPADGMTFDRLSISADGILTVSGSNAVLANEIEVTVPVKLKHKYSVVETDATTHTWARKPVEFNVVLIVRSK